MYSPSFNFELTCLTSGERSEPRDVMVLAEGVNISISTHNLCPLHHWQWIDAPGCSCHDPDCPWGTGSRSMYCAHYPPCGDYVILNGPSMRRISSMLDFVTFGVVRNNVEQIIWANVGRIPSQPSNSNLKLMWLFHSVGTIRIADALTGEANQLVTGVFWSELPVKICNNENV